MAYGRTTRGVRAEWHRIGHPGGVDSLDRSKWLKFLSDVIFAYHFDRAPLRFLKAIGTSIIPDYVQCPSARPLDSGTSSSQLSKIMVQLAKATVQGS